MMHWGMHGPWMLVPILMMLVMFGAMRHHWWSWDRALGPGTRRRDAIAREDAGTGPDQERIEQLERQVDELQSGLEFAERLLANRGEARQVAAARVPSPGDGRAA